MPSTGYLQVPWLLYAPLATEPIIGSLTLTGVLVFVVGMIILWLIVSIPVYIAGKIVTAGESSLVDAMVATLFGPITYAVTLLAVNYLLGDLLGTAAFVLALVLAFIAWVYIFKASFRTGWFGAFATAILAILIFAALSSIFGTLLGVNVPAPFFPRL